MPRTTRVSTRANDLLIPEEGLYHHSKSLNANPNKQRYPERQLCQQKDTLTIECSSCRTNAVLESSIVSLRASHRAGLLSGSVTDPYIHLDVLSGFFRVMVKGNSPPGFYDNRVLALLER